jgi:two-component system alkaline phosphatase synthesis response regulator PhoP
MPKTILVVDDEPDIVRVLKVQLEQDGYQVVSAENGQHALERVTRDRPDLILMDHMMPVMDGLEALEKLKGDPATAQIPVIILTANDDYAQMSRSWEIGSDLYLTKPVPVAELSTIIGCILA